LPLLITISDRDTALGHVLLTMRALNQNRDLLLRAIPMRAARAIVSPSPAILDEPVTPAMVAGTDSRRSEGWS